MQSASPYFSRSYALARERFTAAARPLATRFASYPIAPKGREGEDLATDVALIGAADATRLLIMTSATHGVESWRCWMTPRCWNARARPAWRCCWCMR